MESPALCGLMLSISGGRLLGFPSPAIQLASDLPSNNRSPAVQLFLRREFVILGLGDRYEADCGDDSKEYGSDSYLELYPHLTTKPVPLRWGWKNSKEFYAWISLGAKLLSPPTSVSRWLRP